MFKKITLATLLCSLLVGFGLVGRVEAATSSYSSSLSELASLRKELLSLIIELVNVYAAKNGTTTVNGVTYSTSSLTTLRDSIKVATTTATSSKKSSSKTTSSKNSSDDDDDDDNSNTSSSGTSGSSSGRSSGSGDISGLTGSNPAGTGSLGSQTGGSTGGYDGLSGTSGGSDLPITSVSYPSDTAGPKIVGSKMTFDCNTRYYPGENGEPYVDSTGARLRTLEEYLAHPTDRRYYVSVALPKPLYNNGTIKKGTHLRIPELEKKYGGDKYIDFRAVDTGGALMDKCSNNANSTRPPYFRRIDICTRGTIKDNHPNLEVIILTNEEANKLRLERSAVK